MKKAIFLGFLMSAIAFSQDVIAGQIRPNVEVWKHTSNGRSYLIIFAPNQTQIVTHGQFVNRYSTTVLRIKPKIHKVNECGFRIWRIPATLGDEFTFSYGAVAQEEAYGYSIAQLLEAPALPLCRRNSQGEFIPYLIQGWQP